MQIEEFHKQIDDGQFANVWLATDELGREVAVKIVKDSAVDVSDALDHAVALARVKHKNIVTVYSIDKVVDPHTDKECDAVVMELIEGTTLEDFMITAAPTIDEIQLLSNSLLDGIEAIHAAGIAHGDLHEKNVMVRNGECVIIDILYTTSLRVLRTTNKEMRLACDLFNVRKMVQNLCYMLDDGGAASRAFGSCLSGNVDMAELRAGLAKACSLSEPEKQTLRLDHFIKLFVDKSFSDTDQYAKELVNELDRDLILQSMQQILRDKLARVNRRKLLGHMWSKMSRAEKREFAGELGEYIDSDVPDENWTSTLTTLAACKNECWGMLSARCRLRLQKCIVDDMMNGRHDIYSPTNNTGILGTWVKSFWTLFDDKKAVFDGLVLLLHQGWYSQNYVGKNFMKMLPSIAKVEGRVDEMQRAIAEAIRDDAKMVNRNQKLLPSDWQDVIALYVHSEEL
jgi:tRNA A-37 threonylcarbamoyl transferase component Bud32